jgi:hypothetical protein
MRRWNFAALSGLVLATVAEGAAERFSRAVREAEFAAAGLAKLTPEELARLDALVDQFRSGALERARREAAAAEARAVQAEQRASAVAATTTPVVAGPAKAEPGLLAKAKVVLMPGTRVEYATVESRIAGEFAGWSARTVFVLENGQRWQVSGGDSYVTSPVRGPAVKIVPGALGSFWMTIEGVRTRVRVVRIDAAR